MVMYLPTKTVAMLVGSESAFALPRAVIFGVPAYINGYAAIPLVDGLIETGIAPGSALAFMTADAITSIPPAIVVFALVKREVFMWYLIFAGIGSLFVGQAFQIYMQLI